MRVAINGFGRIGRMTARLLSVQSELELVAVNDLADHHTLAHLFRYDSVHGQFQGMVFVEDQGIRINDQKVSFYRERDPSRLPWDEDKIDLVLECTGKFTKKGDARIHLDSGAKQVIISAATPSIDVPMIVLGVNEQDVDLDAPVLSNASCTTNCAAPMIQLLNELCDIESCYITTVHSYTGDQRLQDAPHKDLRRARAAVQSIVPTTTGAAKALTRIFPGISNSLGGCGIRVPVPDGSLTDITCIVKDPLPAEVINQKFKDASSNRYRNILEYTSDPIVSCDVIGNSHSCIFDSQLTSVIGKMVKIVGWYDNEIGYSNRLVDLSQKIHQNSKLHA